LWAILSDPQRSHNRWQGHEDEFFASGKVDVDLLLADMERLRIELRPGRCLDFGCGIGRVSQALCEVFAEVDGVDIATSMIDAARTWNRRGDRCRYHVNKAHHLRLFDDATFDCVYSRIVLQHMAPHLATTYIAEFMRVLRPGGVAFFQVPSARRSATGNGERSQALPEGTHRADVELLSAPRRVGPGEVVEIRARVRNQSTVTWPAGGSTRVGNHWLRRGRTAIVDDGRVDLPRDLEPAGEVEVALLVRAPLRPGRWTVDVDVIEEGVTWFAAQGSTAATAPVLVRSSAKTRLTSVVAGLRTRPGHAAVIEMHCVPRASVIATIEAAGGRVVEAVEWRDAAAGPDFEDYRYIAIRGPEAGQ
jgi:SAM-dependent methyltransferase